MNSEQRREARWIVLLVAAIAIGTHLKFPMNVVQIVLCGALLALKLYCIFRPD